LTLWCFVWSPNKNWFIWSHAFTLFPCVFLLIVATKTMKSRGCGIKTFPSFVVNVHRMVNCNVSHFINLLYEPHPCITQYLTNKLKQKKSL
jgi:hypothetical protein